MFPDKKVALNHTASFARMQRNSGDESVRCILVIFFPGKQRVLEFSFRNGRDLFCLNSCLCYSVFHEKALAICVGNVMKSGASFSRRRRQFRRALAVQRPRKKRKSQRFEHNRSGNGRGRA